jgi:hypothetical protein
LALGFPYWTGKNGYSGSFFGAVKVTANQNWSVGRSWKNCNFFFTFWALTKLKENTEQKNI